MTARLAWSFADASEIERERLQLTGDQRVLRVSRTVSGDEKIAKIVVATIACSHPIFATLQVLPVDYAMGDALNVPGGHSRQKRRRMASNAALKSAFGLEAGAMVLCLDEVLCDADDRPIEWKMTFCVDPKNEQKFLQ